VKSLFKICLLGLLAGCASTEKVELGNQGYPEAPVSIYLVPMEGISSGDAASLAKEIESRHRIRFLGPYERDIRHFDGPYRSCYL